MEGLQLVTPQRARHLRAVRDEHRSWGGYPPVWQRTGDAARDLGVAVNTLKRYLELLTMSFQCCLLPPWHENVGKRLVKSPKLYFPDVGLNRAVLGELAVNPGAAYETWVFAE